MDLSWKDVGSAIEKIAPVANIVTSLMTGNVVGAAVQAGKLVASALGTDATPDAVAAALSADPEAARKVLELQLTHQVDLQRLAIQATANELAADTAQIQTVNDTMRAEVASSANEAWYQKAWRPACGFSVALGSFAAVVGVIWAFFEALAWGKPEGLSQVPAIASAIALILSVPGAAVGIAAWHRGQQQREAARSDAAGSTA